MITRSMGSPHAVGAAGLGVKSPISKHVSLGKSLKRKAPRRYTSFNSLTSLRQSIIKSATSQAIVDVKAAIAMIKQGGAHTQDAISKYFGSSMTPEEMTGALGIVLNELTVMESNPDYFSTDRQGNKSWYLYVCPNESVTAPPYNNHNVYFRAPFFRLTPRERAICLVHEACHLCLGVDDVKLADGTEAYENENCRQLTIESPEKALNNADNWALFVDYLVKGE